LIATERSTFWLILIITLNMISPLSQVSAYTQTSTNNPTNLVDYTFMIYMMGSDLEDKQYSATNDIREMETVGSTPNVNVIIETGAGGKEATIDHKRFIDFSKVQRHKIIKGSFETLADLGRENMGDPKTLSDFITWGISEFPAKRYAVILWDHGSGINGLGADKNFNNDELNLNEIERAFADSKKTTNKKLELIGFDACLMASIEVADRIEPFGGYMAASEEIEPSWGWDYSAILTSLAINPNQDGSLLGKTIADSFFRYSQAASRVDYNAQKTATLSVINLTKVPSLVQSLEPVSSYLGKTITNNSSVSISLATSVDSTERYGQTAKGSSGLVDVYDLISHIKGKFPQSASLTEEAQRSLNSTVIYKINGNAKPHANGLSIYMPLKKQEFSNSAVYTLPGWQKIVNEHYRLLSSDDQRPFVTFNVTGDIVTGHVQSKDISNVTLGISRQVQDSNRIEFYRQEIEPSSVISSDGSFKYIWNHKIQSLCNNEEKCLPTDMIIKANGDKKIAYFPVILQSQGLNQPVSLTYEITKDGGFDFLGAVPEILQQTTVPKDQRPLYPTDSIYINVEEDLIDFSILEDARGPGAIDKKYTKVGPLQVTKNFGPKYHAYDGNYILQFGICDYSNNCGTSNLIHFNLESKLKMNSFQNQEKLSTHKENTTLPALDGMFTYNDSRQGIQIQYPSDWEEVENNTANDNFIKKVELFSPIESRTDRFLERLGLFVSISNSTMNETINRLINQYSQNKSNFELIESNATTLAGNNHAHKIVFSYNDAQRKFIHMEIMDIKGPKLYVIAYDSEAAKYSKFLPIVQKIINSFKLAELLTYENSNSGFSVQFPYDWQNYENGSFVYFYFPWEDKSDKYRDFVAIESRSYRNMTMDKFISRYIKSAQNSGGDFDFIESNATTLAGNNHAHKIVSTAKYQDSKATVPLKVMEILLIKGSKGYGISYVAEAAKYSKFLPTVQKMINSFKLAELLTYENTTAGIKIQYPYDWIIGMHKEKFRISTEGKTGGFDNIIDFKVLKYLNETYPVGLYVAVNRIPFQNAIGIERSAININRNNPDFELIESNATILAGNNHAHKIVYSYTHPSLGKVKGMDIQMVKGDKWYLLIFEAETAKYSKFLPTVQKMINTFELTD
jgi:Clostripain family/PsbP-like protein